MFNLEPSLLLLFKAEAMSSEKEEDVFMGMVCPTGTNPDDSPLYVLCCNDTCSFTWTGAEHINQVNLGSLGWHFCHLFISPTLQFIF